MYNKRMKLHNKLIIVAATVLVVGGAGTGVALAMQPDKAKTGVDTSLVNSVGNPQNVPESEVAEAPAVVEEQEAVTEPVGQEEAPVEQPTTPEEDHRPKNRQQAMVDAGISGDDVAIASVLTSKADACGFNKTGELTYDDAVEKLKLCVSIVDERFGGSWQAAYNYTVSTTPNNFHPTLY